MRAWAALVLVRTALHFVPLPVLMRRRPAAQPGPAGALPMDRVLVLVDVAIRHTPGRTTCLARAVAVRWLLAGEGIECSVHIGVARRGQALAAHAWLQRGEMLIGCDDHERDGYEELVELEGGRPA